MGSGEVVSSLVPRRLVRFVRRFELIIFHHRASRSVLLFLARRFLVDFNVPSIHSRGVHFINLFQPLRLTFSSGRLIYLRRFRRSSVMLKRGHSTSFTNAIYRIYRDRQVTLLHLSSTSIFSRTRHTRFLIMYRLNSMHGDAVIMWFTRLISQVTFWEVTRHNFFRVRRFRW